VNHKKKEKRKEGVIFLVLMSTCPIFNYASHPLSLGCSDMPTNEPWANFKGLDAPFGKLSKKTCGPLWAVKLDL